ncbi:PfkB family carbohydrate kinase [Labrys monachus]|uniref:Sugar/nucleoside kinase (Ribokinase family) n=1 Tax=Labrys monachus TaxID=217067 RepID=A0ABU0F9Z4_9HYPH|nr:PfkB family carbohydrate kinase [Labrys monachus]MDQ0391433.1 sugar/nucleoside kinase (ribokinase family) [Labrys monachus]
MNDLPDKRPHIVCSGAASFDSIFRMEKLPTGPGKVLPLDAIEVAHGMAASAAAAIARLGGRSTLFSRVGEDGVGARIIADLTEAGIDCAHVRRVPGVRSPICTVLVDATGERLVVPFYDPALGRDPSWLPLGLVAGADAVLVDVRWPEGAALVLKTAREAGIPAVLDADVGPPAVLASLAALASHAVFSEPAAALLSGEVAPAAALPVLARRFDGFLAVTAGPDGCWWLDRETGSIEQLRPPPVVAVDTLAAGDVFHGAFTLALAEGSSIRRAIVFANAAAAFKCRSFGGRLGTPGREEVEAALSTMGDLA